MVSVVDIYNSWHGSVTEFLNKSIIEDKLWNANSSWWCTQMFYYAQTQVCTLSIQMFLSFLIFLFLHPKDFCHLHRPFPTVNDSKLWPGNPPSPFVLLPNTTVVMWASNVTAPASWPPLSALRLLLAREAFSCVKTCQDSGLVCEPAFFTFINNMEAFNG